MKMTAFSLSLLAAVALVPGVLCAASPESPNQVSASLRFGFNISGEFKNIGQGLFAAGTPVPRLTPDGDAYNYDDGYLLTDVSGNYGSETWYVGYDDSAAQIVNDQLLLSRSTASANLSGGDENADTSVGFEVRYRRFIQQRDRWSWGAEASLNYQGVEFSHSSSRYSATLSKVTDAYAITPGTTPPIATPGAPYQGTYGGPGFLFGDALVGTTTQTIPNGATFAGSHDFDGSLWGVHLGLYAERALNERWSAAFAGGFALGFLDTDVKWSESAVLPGGGSAALSGKGSDSEVLPGFYLGAEVSYDFGHQWAAFGGVQYRFLGSYEHSFEGRGVEVDFTGAFYVTLGISKSF